VKRPASPILDRSSRNNPMSEELRIQRLSGNAINPYLPELARLRIQVFQEYPYLYQGTVAYEENYLQSYANNPESVIALAWDGHQVVGASSGLPLAAEPPELIEPFLTHGYDPSRIFYYGESVLLSEYRGRGIGKRFFEEREAHARQIARFDTVCFCALTSRRALLRPDAIPSTTGGVVLHPWSPSMSRYCLVSYAADSAVSHRSYYRGTSRLRTLLHTRHSV